MFLRRSFSTAACAAACIMLAACTQPSAPSPKSVRPSANLVATIRAAGQQDDSVIHVEPLREPGVAQLLDKAHRQETERQYEAAAKTLDNALKLSPNAPDILQYRAELAVRLGDYAKAEKLARRSWRLGPKLGSLCARNWQTVLEMRRIAKDPAGVQAARKAQAQCEESGPVRM